MIAALRGNVLAVGTDRIVVDVHGVGMAALVTPATALAAQVGQELSLHTTLVVREDSLTLYGFAEVADRDAFELLQSVSGIGPKVALAVLTTLPAAQLARAIADEDLAALTSVSGVGRKGAERMLIELRDKSFAVIPAPVSVDVSDSATSQWQVQVSQALVGLGWTTKQASQVVESIDLDAHGVHRGSDGQPDISAVLALAIRSMGR